MIPAFEFATATAILFGAGRVNDVAPSLQGWGVKRALLVTGRNAARAQPLVAALARAGVQTIPFAVTGEPTVDTARQGVAQAAGCDAVVAMGGGSALDAGKAIAALAANGADPLDHLEVVGRGQPLRRPSLPFVAVPTTAGTGAEVTRNAVLAVPEAQVKASLRSPLMLPRLAVVDPDLLMGLPQSVLAASGLDALSQLIEPFFSLRANPLTDALAREAIPRSVRALSRAALTEPDAEGRHDLALASLFGGLCLANAGLGAVHGFAAPVGGMLPVPHGAACAALLLPVLQVNRRALQTRAPADPRLGRFQELAALVTGDPAASVDEGLERLQRLVRDLAVPGLAHYGLDRRDLPRLVEKARAASSMRGNPLPLTDVELEEIAERAL